MMVPRAYTSLHPPPPPPPPPSRSSTSNTSSSTSTFTSTPSPRRSQPTDMGLRPSCRSHSASSPINHLYYKSHSSSPPTSAPRQSQSPSSSPSPIPTTRSAHAQATMERTTSPPTHSKPVDISPRSLAKTSTQIQTVRVRGQNGSRSTRVSKNHRSDAIPPAVAALLAVTSIPPMPNRRRKVPATDRRISMDELIQEWKQDDLDLPPSVVGSPLDLLLGRVEEFDEDEYGSPKSMEQEKDYMTSRSISSESISTIPPSLDLDAPSFASNWDNISTPESYRSERREKVVQSPETEDCVLDHPLLHFNQDDCDDITRVEIADIIASAPASTDRFRSFKSNLTASLQALKSAAKSFSNFTAPSVPPDDLLTRSLLSPRFTSEMRPKLMEGTPSPALRRYLNPQPSSISPTELSMQLHKSLSIDIDIDESTPMIQMQTYDRRGRSVNRKKRGTDQYSEAGRGLSSAPAVRQREPRENSDFLRVIVLEMNMRRVGKLDARAVGRARIWLPPRKLESSKQPPSVQSTSGVPDRWIGLQLADSD